MKTQKSDWFKHVIEFIKNEKTRVFSFFLLATIFIWLLVELSKGYNSSQQFTVAFKRIPKNLILEEKKPQSVDLLMSSPGFSLLKYKITGKKIWFNLDNVKKNKKGYYILPNKQLSNIATQLSESSISRIIQDTLYVSLGKKIIKKVPVRVKLDLKFKQGYQSNPKSITLKPDSVTLSGSKNILDTLSVLETVLFSKKNVSSNIQKTLPFALNFKAYQVRFSSDEVKVFVEVNKFTEGNITLPVVIKNIPRGKKVVPYPAEIKVYYKTDIENFKKIKSNSFEVEFDFKQYLKDTLATKLIPEVKRKSIYSNAVRIVPDKIDFMIENR